MTIEYRILTSAIGVNSIERRMVANNTIKGTS
jgi:hypothetical protein